MDLSAWSPSHTLLLLVTLLAIGAQLVAVLTSLKINTKRLQDSVDKIDTKIDVVQSEIRKEIHEVRDELRTEIHRTRDELRGEIRDMRTELSKINQNHIDHLSHHQS